MGYLVQRALNLSYINNSLINFENLQQKYKKADLSKKCENQKKYIIS